jgi:hypothetical protein
MMNKGIVIPPLSIAIMTYFLFGSVAYGGIPAARMKNP